MAENTVKQTKMRASGFGQRYFFESIESIYLILESGQDILTAVIATKEDAEEKKIKRMLESVSADLKKGAKFWETLSQRQVIPDRFINIIKVGEENGILDQTLRIVLDQYTHEKELKSQVTAASIYPMIVLTLTLVIALGISWFILPQLTTLYGSFGGEIPLMTKILVWFGEFVRTNGYWFLPLILIGIILSVVLHNYVPAVKRINERLLLQLPGIKNLILESEMSRMGFIFGNLLTVGITYDKSLQSIIEATPMLIYRDLYNKYYDAVMQGSSFADYFAANKVSRHIMPASVRHLIVASEKSGSMPKVFTDIGTSYKARMEKTGQNLTKILEPVLLIIMFIFVAVLAIGIIGPIYGQLSSLSSF